MPAENTSIDLSVIIPAENQRENLDTLIPQIQHILSLEGIIYEILIVDRNSDQVIRTFEQKNSVLLLMPDKKGYGNALSLGIRSASGRYILTMDADLSHPPEILHQLWQARRRAEIIIASRYVAGGEAKMPLARFILSRVLNQVFSRGLDLRIHDMSSGYRLYKASIVKSKSYESTDFNILQEILVWALLEGFTVAEIPFKYQPRINISSGARVIKFGLKYLQTFYKMWKLRNSIASADYDARAYVTFMLPQRYWQHQRFKHISRMVPEQDKCLDIGCGSSRILGTLPEGSIGLDILMSKLRYSRRYQKTFVNGSAMALPIASGSFKALICSQVIEHIPRGDVLAELDRVLSPGGILILGTPDYARWEWRWIEKLYKLILPQAYADEHITKYTYRELINEFVITRGYTIVEEHYILNGELILGLRKPIA